MVSFLKPESKTESSLEGFFGQMRISYNIFIHNYLAQVQTTLHQIIKLTPLLQIHYPN
jgi:hypothetical protein